MEHFSSADLDRASAAVIPTGEEIDWTGPWVDARAGTQWVDIRTLDRFVPPTEAFLIRNHGGLQLPTEVEEAEWRLTLDGCFVAPAVLTLDEIKRYPTVSKPVAIECSGNSFTWLATFWELSWHVKLRRAFNPRYWIYVLRMLQRRGWCSMISNAVFTGVRLMDILADHPLSDDAEQLAFFGRDEGVPDEGRGLSYSKVLHNYARSFDVRDLARYDPLICFEMNGAPLTPMHGFPLRVVVPGVYGSEWCKWLGRIEAMPGRFEGFYQTHYYNNPTREVTAGKSEKVMRPVHRMRPKSTVVRVLRREGGVEVYGIAWGGFEPLAKVEISLNGGDSWREAELLFGEPKHSWVFWRLTLTDLERGQRVTVLPRAWTTEGTCQPFEHPWDQHYANNAILPARFVA